MCVRMCVCVCVCALVRGRVVSVRFFVYMCVLCVVSRFLCFCLVLSCVFVFMCFVYMFSVFHALEFVAVQNSCYYSQGKRKHNGACFHKNKIFDARVRMCRDYRSDCCNVRISNL